MRLRIALYASLVVTMGCDPASDHGPVNTGPSGIYVVNEGAFNAGNAELSYIDPEQGTASGSVYSASNPGMTLGDIAQDAVLAFGRLYVTVNNSRKLVVIEPGTHRSLRTITLMRPPRSVCVVSPTRAYITNMDSTVSVVDLVGGAEVDLLTVGPYPEGIVSVGDTIYVLNGGFGFGNSISLVSTTADSVVRTIRTPWGPSYGVVTPGGLLRVVCTGYENYSDPLDRAPGAVLTVDLNSGAVVDTLWLTGMSGKCALAGDGTLFVLGSGTAGAPPVWKISGGPNPAILNSGISAGSYYGIGIDAVRGQLYVAVPGDFVSNGSVEVRSLSGPLIREYTSGIGVVPNGFVFVP